MPYLRLTLASIADQTYANHRVLAWDDSSVDGSLEELRRWIPHRVSGKVFAGETRRLGPALAFLVEQANTELCARIDGDDINLPRRLEQQVSFLNQHPTVGVVGGQIDVIDDQGTVFDRWHYETDDAVLRWRTRWECRLCHPAVLFRKSLVLAAGNYRDVKAEDADLWQRLSAITEFANLPEPLIQYRRTNTSATANISDYLPTNRELARQNAPLLFPGIPAVGDALDLWDATHPSCFHRPSKLRHLWQLRKAAILLAQQSQKPKDYFLNTPLYREQYFHLRRRALKRLGLEPLLRIRTALRAPARSEQI